MRNMNADVGDVLCIFYSFGLRRWFSYNLNIGCEGSRERERESVNVFVLLSFASSLRARTHYAHCTGDKDKKKGARDEHDEKCFADVAKKCLRIRNQSAK